MIRLGVNVVGIGCGIVAIEIIFVEKRSVPCGLIAEAFFFASLLCFTRPPDLLIC